MYTPDITHVVYRQKNASLIKINIKKYFFIL